MTFESNLPEQMPIAAPPHLLPAQAAEGVYSSETHHGRAAGPDVDSALVRLTAAGDREAFATLYLRHRPYLLTFVARRYSLDEHAADDVAGEVFLRFFQRNHDIQITGSLRNYLIGLARNVVADRYGRQDHHEVKFPADVPSPGLSAHGVMEQAEIAEQLAHAVDSLADSHRLAIELRQAGLYYKQIAAVANCTEKAARRRAEKARAKLRFSLSRCGPACVMGTGREDQCPARTKNAYCLKYLFLNTLRFPQKNI